MAGTKRRVPEVNASPQADIAFLLLIFFLVATTMNVDTGIHRNLPPLPPEEEQAPPEIRERNVLNVFVNYANLISVDDERLDISEIKDKTKEFILNPYDAEDLPEKEVREIELLGPYPVSKGVISLLNDRTTSYEMYIKVQNELTRALNEVRDELSQSKFGANYSELSEAQSEAIRKAVPQSISEAEPFDATKGK